jgi:hypothetical protein
VRSLGREAPSAPPPPPAAPLSEPLVAPSPLPPIDRASPELSGEAELRVYPAAGPSAQTTMLWGARLSAGLARGRWHAALDAGGLLHRRYLAAGDVILRVPFIGLTAGPAFTVGGFELRLGVRGEFAWAMVQGQPGAGDVQSGEGAGGVLGLGARIVLQTPGWHRLRGRLAVEAGETLRSVTANVDSIPASAMRGPYALANLGLAF